MARLILKTDDGSFNVDVPIILIGSEYYIEEYAYEEVMNKALKEIERYKQAFEDLKQERVKLISDMQAHIDCLKAELVEVQCHSDKLKQELKMKHNLSAEPIDVASMLIKATSTVRTNYIQKAFNPNALDEYETEKYSKSDLRQIAKHLLAYCKNVENED